MRSPGEGERAAEEVKTDLGLEGNSDESPHVTQHRRTGVLRGEMEFFQQRGAGKHARKSAEPPRTEE